MACSLKLKVHEFSPDFSSLKTVDFWSVVLKSFSDIKPRILLQDAVGGFPLDPLATAAAAGASGSVTTAGTVAGAGAVVVAGSAAGAVSVGGALKGFCPYTRCLSL